MENYFAILFYFKQTSTLMGNINVNIMWKVLEYITISIKHQWKESYTKQNQSKFYNPEPTEIW